MTNQTTELYGDKVFTQDHIDEPDRLEALSGTWDSASHAQLKSLALPARTSCLDVGSGQGVIAAWLADALPDGRIVALDLDTRLLTGLPDRYPNLSVVEADVTTDLGVSGLGTFDLVHARFLLMHLRDRFDVLERLASLVAPGGRLVISDAIDLTTATSAHAPYRQAMAAMWKALNTIGTDVTWVRTTSDAMRRAGLVEVRSEVYLPPVDHRSAAAQFWRMTWSRSRDRMLATGLIDASTFDQAIAGLKDPDFTELSPGIITTCGQRPMA